MLQLQRRQDGRILLLVLACGAACRRRRHGRRERLHDSTLDLGRPVGLQGAPQGSHHGIPAVLLQDDGQGGAHQLANLLLGIHHPAGTQAGNAGRQADKQQAQTRVDASSRVWGKPPQQVGRQLAVQLQRGP
jgi:hypothetical protein